MTFESDFAEDNTEDGKAAVGMEAALSPLSPIGQGGPRVKKQELVHTISGEAIWQRGGSESRRGHVDDAGAA